MEQARYMSLRTKVMLTLGTILALYLLMTFVILQHTVAPTFSQLEDRSALDNLQRVQYLLASDLEHIQRLTRDWGYWDDTYEFVSGRNPDYPSENGLDTMLRHLETSSYRVAAQGPGEDTYCHFFDNSEPPTSGERYLWVRARKPG